MLRKQMLDLQVRGLEELLAAARSGPLLRFEDLLVTVNEELVQDLLTAAMPYERVVDGYRIRVNTARVRFREGLALVELAARASLAGRDERTAFADLRVYGVLEVVGLDPSSGVLHARVPIVGFEVPQVTVLGFSPPVRALVRSLAREPLNEFAELASNIEIPVAVESAIEMPPIEDDDVRIAAAMLPLRVVVEDVKAAAGKLWVTIGMDVQRTAVESAAGWPPRSMATQRPAPAGRPGRGAGGGLASTVAALGGFGAHLQESGAAARALSILDRDPAQPDSADTPAMKAMRLRYAALRDSLLTVAARDTLLARLAADTIDVAVGLRPALVNRLLGRATAAYLGRVELTLELEEEEEEVEDLEVETLFGEVEVGDYRVDVTIHRVEGVLAAGSPRVSFASGNRLDIIIPARILSGHGNATLLFTWDPKGIADLVCDDFTARLRVTGAVVPRSYEVYGAFLLSAKGEEIIVQPQFPKQKVRIAVDPSPDTWAQVRRTLAGLDDLEECGIGLEIVSANKIVRLLERLVAKGFKVKVPTKLIPVLDLPAGLTEEVEVGAHRLRIDAKPRALRVTPAAMWYGADVEVAVEPLPRALILDGGMRS
jgi:hypothetical protein